MTPQGPHDPRDVADPTRPADIQVPSDRVGDMSLADIDAVMDDPTMSDTEKLARLEELRERVIQGDDEQYAPLGTRIVDALSMLAQGGHAYRDTPLDEDDKV